MRAVLVALCLVAFVAGCQSACPCEPCECKTCNCK